jgi:two-component sensor histidine kinase
MTARRKSTLDNLRQEISRLEKELARTTAALEAIMNGQADAIIGPQCPYILKAKQAEDALQQTLREKDVLVKEIHHRVKNNLQIIQSLIHLQSRNISSAEARDSLLTLQNRLRTMALIHEAFYRTEDMASINIAEYLERLAIHLFSVYRVNQEKIKLKTELEPLEISINLAIPVGLIVNELVTNSIKHAFVETDKGMISLKLKCLDNDYCQLSVEDNGRGLPASVNWKTPTTLGLEIVRLLSNQIEAKIELILAAGTRFELIFKKTLT